MRGRSSRRVRRAESTAIESILAPPERSEAPGVSAGLPLPPPSSPRVVGRVSRARRTFCTACRAGSGVPGWRRAPAAGKSAACSASFLPHGREGSSTARTRSLSLSVLFFLSRGDSPPIRRFCAGSRHQSGRLHARVSLSPVTLSSRLR